MLYFGRTFSHLCINKSKKEMKPTVVIGDIHGLDVWKQIIEKHPDCQVVFLGDYLDPREYVPHKYLLRNLQDIISLKRSRPEDVILLLGNHDLHYFCTDIVVSSRFDFSIGERASHLFLENMDAFQYAYQRGNRLFTHAGIAQEWFDNCFHGDINSPIAEQLNHPADSQIAALCQLGYLRGGQKGAIGGIFWADIDELTDPLHGFMQIVGHNQVSEVTEHSGMFDNKIIFCDCLWNGNYLYIEDDNLFKI